MKRLFLNKLQYNPLKKYILYCSSKFSLICLRLHIQTLIQMYYIQNRWPTAHKLLTNKGQKTCESSTWSGIQNCSAEQKFTDVVSEKKVTSVFCINIRKNPKSHFDQGNKLLLDIHNWQSTVLHFSSISLPWSLINEGNHYQAWK